MANTYLTRTQGTPTNNKIFTVSCWFKASQVANEMKLIYSDDNSTNNYTYIHFSDTSGRIRFQNRNGGSNNTELIWENYIRDFSAFYHLVMAVDSTQTTASDRVKFYLNGVQQTTLDSSANTYPPVNQSFTLNSGGYGVDIGSSNTSSYFQGIMSHFHFCDGTQLAPTVFGETDSTTGEWKIKTSPSFTLGNNGFTILKDGNTITDQSSNSNDFSLGGGTLTKTEDCPSNVFATINTLQGTIASGYTIENGNLSTNGTSSNTWRSLPATLASSSGKFYWEIKVAGFSTGMHFGVQDIDQAIQTNNYAYQYSRAYMYLNDGTKSNGGSGSSYGDSWTTNDIIGVALDMDNLKLYFSKNGTWQNSGVPTSGSTGTGAAYTLASGYAYTPMISSYASADKYQCNFGNGYFASTAVSSAGTNASGNGIFEYDTPTGYTALSTKGLNL